jgi:non-ribosomal peptide synthetase component F
MAGALGAADDSTTIGMPASIPELLRIRRAEPDGEFLVTDNERLTFAEADTASLELADALLASGVGKGTRVGILFPNCSQWLISWLAAARIGALTVPLSTFAPGAELGRLLRHTDVQVVLMGQAIAGRDLVERIQEAVPGVSDGGAAIAAPVAPYYGGYTSGRTATAPGRRRGRARNRLHRWHVRPKTRCGPQTASSWSPPQVRRHSRSPWCTRTAAWCATPTFWRATAVSPRLTASIRRCRSSGWAA